MNEIAQMVSTYGLAVVIAVVFIYDKMVNTKKQLELAQTSRELLISIEQLARAQSAALELLTITIKSVEGSMGALHRREDEFAQTYTRHDERARGAYEDILVSLGKLLENQRFYMQQDTAKGESNG
jgi:hypothetical protein